MDGSWKHTIALIGPSGHLPAGGSTGRIGSQNDPGMALVQELIHDPVMLELMEKSDTPIEMENGNRGAQTLPNIDQRIRVSCRLWLRGFSIAAFKGEQNPRWGRTMLAPNELARDADINNW